MDSIDDEIRYRFELYSTHKKNDDWLAKFESRVQFHFTPTSASWLSQIEVVFSLLQRRTLNGASFKTKDQLREAIEAFIQKHNERPKPFRWRKRQVKGRRSDFARTRAKLGENADTESVGS